MTLLELAGVSVRFGERAVVDRVDLRVAEHEIVCVLGPSGSGKSTLLRVVAGLQPVAAGRVLLGGADQARVPVHRRGVGLMFQDHQLFPHRNVGENVAFGLRMQGAAAGLRGLPGLPGLRGRRRGADGPPEDRVAELLELVGLPGARQRAVSSLSGGEQQRVALARALAPAPRLLMLDEPLGQLDRGLRERLVVELRALFTRLGTTVLAVTHDQGEAFALADRVVVMSEGRIAQAGTPLEVWQRPASEFVARFLGFENVVPATVSGGAAATAWGEVPVPEGSPEGEQRVLIRPAGVVLAAAGLGCEVLSRTFRGTHVALRLRPEAGPDLEAECGPAAAPAVGARVAVAFTPSEVVVLPAA
ncbi:ABC transporter ATP-binding protein [Streptomyces sp. NPDC007369]|uniref:ABC transporter ATP-binding protein n=1 Tax=Streptomyces sp. NPDC007369 TaxID=3154589 RepID=UPI0033E2A4DE